MTNYSYFSTPVRYTITRNFLLTTLLTTKGYYHIGSLLMLIHDASDIPLDLLKIFMLINWDVLTVCLCIIPCR